MIKTTELEIVCGVTSKLPDTDKPEIAFAGKSNVGKSSLINGLMNRKSLARISAQPGKTQTINYYNINHAMYLVDLPGYGYAKVPQREKEKWGRMVENYLHSSKQLKAVFLLVDIRHAPSDNDRQMYGWIVYHGYDPIIIATKSDKVKDSQQEKHLEMIREGLGVKPGTPILPYSSLTKRGREEIWELMGRIAGLEEPKQAKDPAKAGAPGQAKGSAKAGKPDQAKGFAGAGKIEQAKGSARAGKPGDFAETGGPGQEKNPAGDAKPGREKERKPRRPRKPAKAAKGRTAKARKKAKAGKGISRKGRK